MLDHLLREPDALALVLLVVLVGLTVAVGLVAARHRDAAEEDREASAQQEMVTTWPHLLRWELVAALATLLAVSWWAIGFPLPLGAPADPSMTPAVAKAPWFFIGVQEMLQYFDAWLAGAVLPLLMLVGLCALPYLDVNPEGNGRYTIRRRPVALAVVGGLIVMWLAPMLVGQLLRGEHWVLQPAWRPPPVETPLPPAQLLSAADRLGLSGAAAQILGGALCLGPYLALAFLWRPLSRRSPSVARMGRVRFMLAGTLLVTALGVAIKVSLVAALDLRYLWVNPWFRI